MKTTFTNRTVMLFLSLLLAATPAFAQSVVFNPPVATYKMASVTSAGVVTDAPTSFTLSATTKGWVEFNLSGIPAGATVLSATYSFYKNSATGTNTPAPNYNITMYVGGFSSMIGGNTTTNTTLYGAITGAATTSVNTQNWTPATVGAYRDLTISAAGLTLLQNNLTSTVSIGMSLSGNRTFNIAGYSSANPPKLTIVYCVQGDIVNTPETFCALTVPPAGWSSVDPSGYLLSANQSAFGIGNGSAEFDFYDADPSGDPAASDIELITPVLSPVPVNSELSFDEAYATYFLGENDQLQIRTSTNGGTSWTTLTTYNGGNAGPLNTGGSVFGSYTPAATEWATKTISLPAGTNKIMFKGISAYGNNLYLDNIHITSPLATRTSKITAANVGARNRVDWSTATELAGDAYIIERSADGRNFTQLGTVKANGNPSEYTYWDEQPVNGINYYRINSVDVASHSIYSATVSAVASKVDAFTVEAYPNPVKDLLTIKVFGTPSANAMITITDITGKTIKTISVTDAKIEMDISDIAQGIYLLNYADNGHIKTIRISKQ